jgi:hypothetical protein
MGPVGRVAIQLDLPDFTCTVTAFTRTWVRYLANTPHESYQ